MLFFYLFPSGRFVPRWTRFCALAWAVYASLWATPIGASHWPWGLSLASAIVLWGSFPVSQVYRYRRVSTPTERQWICAGFVEDFDAVAARTTPRDRPLPGVLPS